MRSLLQETLCRKPQGNLEPVQNTAAWPEGPFWRFCQNGFYRPADEIVRQLRLRDIGGIIIIDFIDMLFERNQQAVVDRLRAALVRDKTKSQVMEVSSLGLVQMTRKRVSGGLLDSFSETCPTCDGRGVVITHEIQ
jgi:Rne/Rng family ribonuclease